MLAKSSPLAGLFSRLGSAGIPSSFARKVLPSWWDDEVAKEPAGLQQAQLYFSRAFNIDLQSLADRTAEPRFRASVKKFKLSQNVSEGEVSVGANYATGIAKLALSGVDSKQKALPKDPLKLRQQILQTHECVSLEGLLDWCVNAAIPVIHVEKLPGKKMTGLVVRDSDRFAIVLSKNGHPAFLLFHLAHELAHIAKGHLTADGFVADEKIRGADSSDADEKEADAYAIRLINGKDVAYHAAGRITSGPALCSAAIARGAEQKIDPGHIILNFAHNQRQFPLANLALKSLPGPSDGREVVNSVFFASVSSDAISDDQFDLLKVATGHSTALA
jgi:hypothetical protein